MTTRFISAINFLFGLNYNPYLCEIRIAVCLLSVYSSCCLLYVCRQFHYCVLLFLWAKRHSAGGNRSSYTGLSSNLTVYFSICRWIKDLRSISFHHLSFPFVFIVTFLLLQRFLGVFDELSVSPWYVSEAECADPLFHFETPRCEVGLGDPCASRIVTSGVVCGPTRYWIIAG